MITFVTPVALAAAGAVFLLGLMALWRGRHNRVAVSSTLLWRDLPGEAAGHTRRRVDPLWLLLFLAAVMAAAAVAGPTWVINPQPETPRGRLIAQMRALPGAGHAELFLRVVEDQHLPARVTVVVAPENAEKTERLEFSRAQITAGVTVPRPVVDRLVVRVLAGGVPLRGEGGGGAASLVRLTQPPLTIYERGRAPPALRHVFEIQPGAQAAARDLPGGLTVLLVAARGATSAPATVPGETAPPLAARWPQRDALVVFTGHFVPGDLGVSSPEDAAAAWVALAPPAPIVNSETASPLIKSLTFGGRASACRAVEFSPEWEVLARLGDPRSGRPFVAARRDARANVTFIYLASDLLRTDWPVDLSFVLFFSNVLDAMSPGPAGGETLEWAAAPLPLPAPAEPTIIALAPWLGLTVAVLVAVCAWALYRRAGLGRQV